ncbi:MAG: hypothetical protein AB8E15_02000 [Bdellovibrionales bacterium]
MYKLILGLLFTTLSLSIMADDYGPSDSTAPKATYKSKYYKKTRDSSQYKSKYYKSSRSTKNAEQSKLEESPTEFMVPSIIGSFGFHSGGDIVGYVESATGETYDLLAGDGISFMAGVSMNVPVVEGFLSTAEITAGIVYGSTPGSGVEVSSTRIPVNAMLYTAIPSSPKLRLGLGGTGHFFGQVNLVDGFSEQSLFYDPAFGLSLGLDYNLGSSSAKPIRLGIKYVQITYTVSDFDQNINLDGTNTSIELSGSF